jgi:hypothetical protein
LRRVGFWERFSLGEQSPKAWLLVHGRRHPFGRIDGSSLLPCRHSGFDTRAWRG